MLTHEMKEKTDQGSARQVQVTTGVKGKIKWLAWLDHHDLEAPRAFAAMWQAFDALDDDTRESLYRATRAIKSIQDDGFPMIVVPEKKQHQGSSTIDSGIVPIVETSEPAGGKPRVRKPQKRRA